MGSNVDGEYRLDEIDRRIIYELMRDARGASPPAIGEELGVTGATIRNRIAELEDHGIVTGYHATVDFEHADGALVNVFLCHAPFGEAEGVARRAGTIPGVINVRELLGGRTNLHVQAVGDDTADLRRIGRELERLGAEVEDEYLLQEAFHFPYAPYGPAPGSRQEPLADYLSLAGGAEVVELTVHEDAPVAGRSLAEAVADGIVAEETLVIAIERDEDVLTPQGETRIEPNDIVTVFSPEGTDHPSLDAFRGPDGLPRTDGGRR